MPASPLLCTPPGNDVSSTVAATFTPPATVLSVQSGDIGRLGSPTQASPVRVRLVKQSQQAGGLWAISDPTAAATYHFTGIAGSTLTGGVFESGTSQTFVAGDLVVVAACAEDLSSIHAHLRSGVVNVRTAGAALGVVVVGDGVANDGPSIQAIINASPGRRIYFPSRGANDSDTSPSFYCGTTTLTVSAPGTTLEGDGGAYIGGTVLKWSPRVSGVYLDGPGSTARDLCLVGGDPWNGVFYDQGIIPARRIPGVPGFNETIGANAADGIRVGQPYCRLSNITAIYWGRDGVNCSAGDQDEAVGLGAEDCQFDRLFLGNNRGNGLKIQGGDSNCTQVNAATVFVNQFWGIRNEAFLAGSFVSPQATQNGFDNSANLTGNGLASVAVTSLARSGNAVTAAFPAPLYADDGAATPLVAGDGIRVLTCGDASFLGRWRVLTVSVDNRTFTWHQVAADATTTAGITARTNWLPPDFAIASAARASGVVTLAATTPMVTGPAGSTGHESLVGRPMQVGQGITLVNCPDASFNGTFVVLSVSNGGATVTYAQTAADASISSGTARAAIPEDTWAAAAPLGLRGGSYYSSSFSAPTVWVNPYAEGGQASAFANPNVILAPTWSDSPSFTWAAPDGTAATGLPLVIYGAGSGTGSPSTSAPLGVVSPGDRGIGSQVVAGTTAAQPLSESYCSPVNVAGVFPVIWHRRTTAGDWTITQGDPDQSGAVPRLHFGNAASGAAGYTYLNSSGAGPVRINADAATGTGGVVIGDGTGVASTSLLGGSIAPTAIHDAAAANGALFLGLDHLDGAGAAKLCRKSSVGTVTVLG